MQAAARNFLGWPGKSIYRPDLIFSPELKNKYKLQPVLAILSFYSVDFPFLVCLVVIHLFFFPRNPVSVQ